MRNVEVKVRANDLAAVEARLGAIPGVRNGGVLRQRDVFLPSRSGRLKLRLENDAAAQLIGYHRADEARLRTSQFEICPIDDAPTFLSIARSAWGALPEVRKERHLYWVDNIRVHLDRVEGLGNFVELEACVDESHDESACHDAARRLLRNLGLESATPESGAYVDLLNIGAAAAALEADAKASVQAKRRPDQPK